MFTSDTRGKSSNNRVEFIALWTILKSTSTKGIKKIQILGVSKLVVDWANRNITVSYVRLHSTLSEIRQFLSSLEWYSITHIMIFFTGIYIYFKFVQYNFLLARMSDLTNL
jgi:hypothetical protein